MRREEHNATKAELVGDKRVRPCPAKPGGAFGRLGLGRRGSGLRDLRGKRYRGEADEGLSPSLRTIRLREVRFSVVHLGLGVAPRRPFR